MDEFFGDPIANPLASGYGYLEDGGLISFFSNLIRFIMILSGIWTFINLIVAGLEYIASNAEPEIIAKAWRRIYMSLIGLGVIVASFAIAAIIGLILFGDARAILQPQIYGPGSNSPSSGSGSAPPGVNYE